MLRYLCLLACLVTFKPAIAANDMPPFDGSVELSRIRGVLETGRQRDLAMKVDRSIEQMVRLATHKLRQKGLKTEAREWENDYRLHFEGRLTYMVTARAEGRLRDIGDWAPMSQWLKEFYDRLESVLGEEIMAFTHLEDIKFINYCVPVVFNFESIPDDLISPAEYKKHFVVLGGLTAFWTVSIACDIGTWGTGYWLICTPAGMLAKYATVNYIAPPMSPRWYQFFYKD
jgi:hypothetical protein